MRSYIVQYGPIRSNIVYFGPTRSNMVNFGPIHSNTALCGPIQSNTLHYGSLRSNVIKYSCNAVQNVFLNSVKHCHRSMNVLSSSGLDDCSLEALEVPVSIKSLIAVWYVLKPSLPAGILTGWNLYHKRHFLQVYSSSSPVWTSMRRLTCELKHLTSRHKR